MDQWKYLGRVAVNYCEVRLEFASVKGRQPYLLHAVQRQPWYGRFHDTGTLFIGLIGSGDVAGEEFFGADMSEKDAGQRAAMVLFAKGQAPSKRSR